MKEAGAIINQLAVFMLSGITLAFAGPPDIASAADRFDRPALDFGTCTPEGMYCVYFSPQDQPIYSVTQYLSEAKTSIRIAAYKMDTEEFVPIIKDKLAHGVKVELLADFRQSLRRRHVFRQFEPHPLLSLWRLPVMRGRAPQSHNKIMIIDNQVVLTGSVNFTFGGLVSNNDHLIAVRRPDVVQKYNDELDELPWLSAALGVVAADWLSSVAVAATVAACVAVLVW